MVFNTGAALLDAIVLAVVSREPDGAYGYRITQEVRQAVELSESTLYPVLRRLQADGCLEAYDMEYGGRNRRYYQVTERGRAQLGLYMEEWKNIPAESQICLRAGREVKGNEQSGIYGTASGASGGYSSGGAGGCASIL